MRGPALRELAGAIRGLEDLCAEIFDKVSQKDPTKDIQNMVWDCRVQLARLTGIADLCDQVSDRQNRVERHLLDGVHQGGKHQVRRDAAGHRAAHEGGRFRANQDRGLHLRNPDGGGELRTTGQGGSAWTIPGRRSRCTRLSLHRSITGRTCFSASPPMPRLRTPRSTSAFLSDFITRALTSSRGAGLVLFTSYALLRETYAEVQPALAARGIRILRQGDDERSRLLDAFRAERSSVLFATDSFWEGVDVPGETLQMVILCRLPFPRPHRTCAQGEDGGN